MTETIAAIATAPGRGGVGVIRVSGPLTKVVCEKITKLNPSARHAHFSNFYAANGESLDSGLAIFFPGPNSFTGEDVLELHGHGGPVILDMILKQILQHGVRMARAGEFSERAFLNNKIDLLQAEAIAQLINANSEQAALAATRSLRGDFSKAIDGLLADLVGLRVYVEAAMDFPDEDIDFLQDQNVLMRLEKIINRFSDINTKAREGVLLNEGINVVIAGKPNVGKSTLLNALAGEDCAIVTEIAGTTRDVIKTQVNIDGLILNIADTAGIHVTNDIVERLGIERAKRELKNADLVLYVSDVTDIKSPSDLPLNKSCKIIWVRNKIDLHSKQAALVEDEYNSVYISANNQTGLDLLKKQIKKIVGFSTGCEGAVFMARRRHLNALSETEMCINNAKVQLANNAGELVAEELKLAQNYLSEITGAFSSDDLLGKIFSEFCIGK